MKNSADLGGCYPPRPSAPVDNTLLYLQNSSYPTQPHSIITNYTIPFKSSTCFNYVFVGRKYNKDGDLVNWWSNSSNEAFEKKSHCFIKQYSSFEAYGKKVRNFTNTESRFNFS